MDVTPLIRVGTQVVQSYAGGVFRISGSVFEGPVIVHAQATEHWSLAVPVSVSGLDGGPEGFVSSDFDIAVRMKPDFDVMLLGTGARLRFLPPDFRGALREQGLVFDVMDTGAACRTYNVLVAEGRRVAAFLLPALVG